MLTDEQSKIRKENLKARALAKKRRLKNVATARLIQKVMDERKSHQCNVSYNSTPKNRRQVLNLKPFSGSNMMDYDFA